MAELPYMQFFPADYLRDTELLSLSAQGGWMRMLCSMWHPSRRGVLSLRLQAMARLLSANEKTTKSIIRELVEIGVADVHWEANGVAIGHPNGEADGGDDSLMVTITCRRIVRDWGKADAKKKTLSDAGKNGAAKRWAKSQANGVAIDHPNGEAISPPYGNPESRIQNHTLSLNPTEIPTLEAVQKFAKANFAPPISEQCAMTYHNDRESVGWVNGKGQEITNWHADLRSYASRWNTNERSPRAANSSNVPFRNPKKRREGEYDQGELRPLPDA